MMNRSNFRNSETFNTLMAVGAVLALGFGTATAAIAVAPRDVVNPAMRPLASGTSIQLKAVYGQDDEDCVWVTAKTMQPNGKISLTRKLECAR